MGMEWQVKYRRRESVSQQWNRKLSGTFQSAKKKQKWFAENGFETRMEYRETGEWKPVGTAGSLPMRVDRRTKQPLSLVEVASKLKLKPGDVFPSPRELALKLHITRHNAAEVKQLAITNGYVRSGLRRVLTVTREKV